MNARNCRLYGAVELAEEVGITPRALRFYETKGLIEPRRAGARRVYDYRDRARLNLILRGKRLGFSLAEIREYLDLYDADPTQTEQIQRLHQAVARRIHDLEQQREALDCALTELERIRDQAREALRERGIPPLDATPPAAGRNAGTIPPIEGDDAR